MKRRNFLKSAVAALVGTAGCKCLVAPKAEESVKLWGKEPVDMVFVNGKWTTDPFIKINLIKNKTTYYNNFYFTQISENHVLVADKESVDKKHRQFVPIDFKTNQKSKGDFITELNKYDCKWDIFELIADNGKSNIYAQAVNSENNNKAWGT